jgi:hypothetical protein
MQIKKPKISKRTIIITAIVIILIGIPSIYFLWIRNQENSRAWYSSSWMYRRAITVTNAGGTLTNEDVLITLDTAALISAGKLQSDCDDLRFLDSNDATLLTYWIEGGCNTSTTQVWVQIPSLTTGNYTVYVYYGNSSATNAEASWTGEFIFLSDSSCPTGWTRNDDFDNNFPYISSSYGSTGGSNNTHSHSISTTVSSTSGVVNIIGPAGGTNNFPTYEHYHTLSAFTDSAPILPPYIGMYFCNNDNLNLEEDLITPFTSTLTTGWTQFSALDSRFPRGANSYGATGGTSSTHTHGTSITTTDGSVSGYFADVGTSVSTGSNTIITNHYHTISSATIGYSSGLPPYYTVIYAKASSASASKSGLQAMATAQPPLGWSTYSTTYLNRFLMGDTTSGTTGGTTTHSHTFSGTTTTATVTNTSTVGTSGWVTSSYDSSHTHSFSGTSASVSNLPSYVTVPIFTREASLSASIGTEEVGNENPTAPTSLLAEGTTNPTRVTDTTPEFSAIFNDPDTLDTGAYWEIEVNTNSAFTGTVMWDSGKLALLGVSNGERSGDIPYAGTTLSLNGITYYWRIKFWDQNDGESPWSSVASFRMNTTPTQPTSLLAEGEASPQHVTDLTPEFSAIFNDPDGDNATYYEIEINSELLFNGHSVWDTGQTALTPISSGTRMPDVSFYDPQNPMQTDGDTYYWRIRFWDQYGIVSPWSSTSQFTMNRTPEAPTLPLTEGSTNPTKVTDLTPEFSAIFNDSDNNRAAYYQIEVNTNSSFNGTVKWSSAKTSMTLTNNGARTPDISYAGSSLTLNGTTYYWKIMLWDEYDTQSPYSSTAQFTMSGAPNSPTDLTVDGNTNPTILSSPTPTFSAIHSDPNSDSATYYEIEVNSNSSFTGTVMWDTGKASMTSTANNTRSPEITYAGTALTGTQNTYYWRIRFWDTDDNVSSWSTTANFKDSLTHMYLGGIKLGGIKID